jgi:hypothetical protein
MWGIIFMQLLIALFLVFYANKFGLNEEVKPLIKNVCGDEIGKAIEEAESVSSIISAMQGFSSEADNLSDEQGLDGSEGFFDASNEDKNDNFNNDIANNDDANSADAPEQLDRANEFNGEETTDYSINEQSVEQNNGNFAKPAFSGKPAKQSIMFPFEPIIDIVDRDTAFYMTKYFANKM